MLLIKNGYIVDPVTNTEGYYDILIDHDEIKQVDQDIKIDHVDVINAKDCIVAPGLVDAHVHFRDPGFTYKEDIITGAAAAKKGGFTTVICMANTNPPVDNIDTLTANIQKGETTKIHVLQCATVTKGMKGQELVDMKALKAAGAAGFTDDGIPILNEKVVYEAFKQAKKLDMPVSLHEEDPEYILAPGVNMGKVSQSINYGGASHKAEDVMVERDCQIALETGARVCIQHISSKESVDIVRRYRHRCDVHAEATPHHFTLTEDAILKYGTNARMNPPVRTEEDRLAIIEGLKDGTIDMIVTDHAPHSDEEKAREMSKAPSGITGLETSLALGIKSLVQPGHISMMKLMALMSKNPSEFYHLTPVSIQPGAKADLVIFNPDETWLVDHFASKASNSPFIGWELPGKIHYTICNGQIVYKG